jgi:hypothetical protein
MFNAEQLKEILLKNDILSLEDYEKLEKEADDNDKDLETLIFDKKIIEEKDFYEKAAAFFKVPFVNLKDQTIKKEALFNVPEPIAIAHNIIAFDFNDKELKIAVLDPEDLETFEFIKKKVKLKPIIHLTTPDNIKDGLKQYRQSLKNELKEFSEERGDIESIGLPAGQEDLENH